MKRGPKAPTICETCENSVGRCSWSKRFEPVEGWEAEPTRVICDNRYEQSYRVRKCPEYDPSIRHAPRRSYTLKRGANRLFFDSDEKVKMFFGLKSLARLHYAVAHGFKYHGYDVYMESEE